MIRPVTKKLGIGLHQCVEGNVRPLLLLLHALRIWESGVRARCSTFPSPFLSSTMEIRLQDVHIEGGIGLARTAGRGRRLFRQRASKTFEALNSGFQCWRFSRQQNSSISGKEATRDCGGGGFGRGRRIMIHLPCSISSGGRGRAKKGVGRTPPGYSFPILLWPFFIRPGEGEGWTRSLKE